MSVLTDKDSGFPWFEETYYTGWLVQFKAYLRKSGSHVVLLDNCMCIGIIDNNTALIAMFVDDIFVASASNTLVMHVETVFNKKIWINAQVGFTVPV